MIYTVFIIDYIHHLINESKMLIFAYNSDRRGATTTSHLHHHNLVIYIEPDRYVLAGIFTNLI